MIALGILQSLKNKLISIDESEQLLFRPGITIKLKKKKCNKEVVDLLEYCCEIEDIESLLPEIYEAKLIEFIERNISVLKEYYMNIEYNDMHILEKIINSEFEIIELDQIKQKCILIHLVGILNGIKFGLLTFEEYTQYLCYYKNIDIVKEEKYDNVIKNLLEESNEVSNIYKEESKELFISKVEDLIIKVNKEVNNIKNL